jgi:hypothetical protein
MATLVNAAEFLARLATSAHKYFWYVDLLRLAFYLAAANAILSVELCWLFLVPISNKAVSHDSQAISYVDDVYN